MSSNVFPISYLEPKMQIVRFSANTLWKCVVEFRVHFSVHMVSVCGWELYTHIGVYLSFVKRETLLCLSLSCQYVEAALNLWHHLLFTTCEINGRGIWPNKKKEVEIHHKTVGQNNSNWIDIYGEKYLRWNITISSISLCHANARNVEKFSVKCHKMATRIFFGKSSQFSTIILRESSSSFSLSITCLALLQFSKAIEFNAQYSHFQQTKLLDEHSKLLLHDIQAKI